MAENQNIRSSRGAAEYSLTFEIVLPGGQIQFCFSNSPAGRLSPIDKPAKADRSGDRTRPPQAAESPSLSSIWIVYTDKPLMVFSGPIVKVGRFCKSKVEKSTVESNGGQPTAKGLSRTVDYNANSNPNGHTVNTLTVVVNIVTLNYVIVARVVSLLSLSIIMVFRVLKCCKQSELVCVKLFKAWVDFKYYIQYIKVQ